MAVAVRTASLRRRITFESRATAVDGIGGQSTTWTAIATVWADVQPVSGRERQIAAAMQTSITHQIYIRYQRQFADPKVMAAMRAKETKDGVTRIFDIHDARDMEERRKIIVLDVEEGLNDG